MNDLLRQSPIPAPLFPELINLREMTSLDDWKDPDVLIGKAKILDFPRLANWIRENSEDCLFGLATGQWILTPEMQDEGSVVLKYYNGHQVTNVPMMAVRSSPAHSWGYGGTGPNQLALSILTNLIPPTEETVVDDIRAGSTSRLAWELYPKFVVDVLCTLPQEESTIIPLSLIDAWIRIQRQNLRPVGQA